MQIILNPYQWNFMTSRERFPGLVSGWGTGKTLCLIQRSVLLSQCYRDNLGLVVRKVYKDLADSTIKDFELYTGLKVPQSTRDVVLPGSNSRIMFRHLEELTSGPTKTLIQNVNLGWFAIEQAEEFDTSEQFEMLRGRLRRVLQPFDGYYEARSKRNALFASSDTCVFCKKGEIVEGSEAKELIQAKSVAKSGLRDPNIEEMDGFVFCRSCQGFWSRDPDARMEDFLEYLKENQLRTGFVIANANGKNWVWRNWLGRDISPGFSGGQARTFDNEHNLVKDFVDDLRSMAQGTETQKRKYRRYVENCHDEADVEGCYYGKLMQDARSEGRIGRFPPDRSVATHTVWDLGINDTTAIWFIQKIGREVRHIGYYENSGEGIEHYVRTLETYRDKFGLHYGKHFWPHDGKKRDLSTGKELRKTAQEMGLNPTILKREKKVVDGIERARKMIPNCTYDEIECANGIEALEHYQRRKNHAMSTEEKSVWSDTPLHDWSSNGADAERYVSEAIKKLGGGMTAQEVRELQEMYT